jgi:ring-opening amidohydrolase-like protein
MPIEVRKVEITSVQDASGLAELIDDGVFEADEVIAVIGKTEGNGGVNDYTRILADQAFRNVLLEKGSRSLDEIKELPMVWSGGCDGVITPHATVFARVPDAEGQTDEPRLAVGIAMSDVILPEDIGRPAMVEKVAVGVKRAMEAAGITDTDEVHYVQTKTPLLVQETIQDAHSRGETVYTEDTLYSMDISNGTTGLGIAYALGEIDHLPTEDEIGRNHDLYSSVASCSSGVELDRAQIVVVGNAPGSGSRYRIGHSVMEDAIDQDGIWEAIRSAGLDLPERPHHSDLDGRLVNVFLKCEADPRGTLRGRRQLPLDDSDVHHHRQIKGAVGGVTAATIGDSACFVSVAALHQGPLGGGPVAAIVRVDD